MKASSKVLSAALIVFVIVIVGSAVVLRRQIMSEHSNWQPPQQTITINKTLRQSFKKLVVAVGQQRVHLIIKHTNKPAVTIQSFAMFKPYLKISNKDGTLSVYTPEHIKLTSSLPINITIATDQAIGDIKIM